ncbi:MAG: hypothetical protein LQ348_006759 [Seirophora lacunosa]|nr:MAG: hypothetical protein LQ348_006759 [Seirophora lacunosa]
MAFTLSSLLLHQPFKTIYILGALLYNLFLLPLCLLFYLSPTLRQHPSYTYRQALMVRLLKIYIYHMSRIRSHPAWTLAPGSEGQRFTPIPPSDKPIYRGELDDPDIKPARIGGTWYPTVYDPSSPEEKGKKPSTVILHIHFGAFVIGEGRSEDLGYGAHLLTSHTRRSNARVFAVQYRLSSLGPGCRFPAPLQDVVTAYAHLLDLGIPATSIVVSGDSAGGNLAIAFLRYISAQQQQHPGGGVLLPAPAAALLWGPWTHPGAATRPRSRTGDPSYATDFLDDALLEWGVRAYAPPRSGVDPDGAWVSPRDHPFACAGVPLWVQFGALEVMGGDVVRFAEGMRGVRGNEVELVEVEGAPHDIFLLGRLLGFGDMAEEMAEKMGAWLRGKGL